MTRTIFAEEPGAGKLACPVLETNGSREGDVEFIKAATKATGRALAALGYGTAFAPELDEEERVVDSPVEKRPARGQTAAEPLGPSEAPEAGEQPATEQQLQSIRKLCVALGREEPAPEVLTFASAGSLIRQLSKEYGAQRRAG